MSSVDMRLVQARWVLGHISSGDIPRIARDALEAGLDTPSLRMLAGEETPIMSEVGPVLERAFRELGNVPLGRESAGLCIAQRWAHAILKGDTHPYDGAKAIWSEVCDRLGDKSEFFVFKALASEHEDYRFMRSSHPQAYDRKIRDCEDRIIEAAKSLLAEPRIG